MISAGTLAPPTSRAQVGFPDLSKIGVAFPAAYNQLFLTDYSKAIPVANLAKSYQVLIPTTDADGNDVSGVRVPDVSVPIATYTGWNLRKAGFAPGEGVLKHWLNHSLREDGCRSKREWRSAPISRRALQQQGRLRQQGAAGVEGVGRAATIVGRRRKRVRQGGAKGICAAVERLPKFLLL